MAETLKFGPEWLRALSDGNSVTSPPPSPGPGLPKYKLAEHRYGREEMLALCHPNPHIPDEIYAVPVILLEKPQEPMAYIPLTEEEQRMMSQSVNSPAVLRMMGRGSSGAGGGATAAPTRGGGRGTVSERGRGRGRGRGDPFGRPGEVTEPEEPGFGRGRSYVRSESWEEGRSDKRFERGGFVPGRPEPEADPTSPRREFSRSMSDNWRCSKQVVEVEKRSSSTSQTSVLGGGDSVEEDNGGDWRRATSKAHDKWANRNWRDRTRNSSDDRFQPLQEEQRSYRRQRSSGSYDEDFDPNGLPEWSTMDADDMEALGTFDSSGAFMSMRDAMALKAEEEREERWRKDSRGSSGSNEERHSNNSTNGAIKKSDTEGIPDDQPSSDKPSAKDREPPEAQAAANSVQGKQQKTVKPQKKSKQKVENVNNNIQSVSSSAENQDSFRVQKTPEPVPQRGQPQPVQNGSALPPAPPMKPEQHPMEGNDRRSGPPPQLHAPPHMGGQKRREDEISFDHLETAAEEMVANWTAEEDAKSDGKHTVENGALPWEHDDAKRWFYRDPQGELQGPFNSNEMAEWFSAGYFTMNLLVKRGCDDRFQPLGEIIKRWGRVPFLPGPSPPPLLHTPVSQPGPAMVATAVSDQPQPQPGQNPQMDPQMKMLQQHLALQQQLFQQQVYIRQLQVLQQVQQNERCSKLPPEQQQQLVLQLLMKQHQQLAAQAQQQQVQQPPGQLPQQQQQKISPRSTPDQVGAANFQNNPELAAMMNQNLQTQGANQANPGAWMQESSVWDLPGDSAAKQQAMEEFARIEKDQKSNDQRDAELRQKQKEDEEDQKQRHKQEMMRQQDEMKRLEELRRQQEEMQRVEEMRRQQEMERRQMEMQQEEEARRRREEEERRRLEEEMRQRQEMEQRQREMEQQLERQRDMERQIKEAQRHQEETERRNLEDMQRRKEIELENQRQQEIQRRSEMQRQQEIQHQQQEALRRLQQQQQLAQIQLPSTAQWGSQTSAGAPPPTNTMSLAQIQQLQEEKERNDRDEHQRQLEIQRQQLQAFQQQHQQQPKKWGNSQRMANPAAAATQLKTLMEIQEEQARQLEKEKINKQQAKASVPLASAAVWGGSTNSSHWAQEGAWGQAAKQQGLGFWDEAVKTSKNKVAPNNQTFPALNKPTITANNQMNKKTAKTQREEENIQRLFQERLPSGNDDFSQWCESALHGMKASVDIPTFVTFLCEVDSPYEVHDYVRSYLGETRDASNFAKMFIEKRSKSRNHHRPVEDSMWGPAPAVNPNLPRAGQPTTGDYEKMAIAANKKSNKKKMQKLDNSILGFTVHANPDRVNVGEIDMCD